MEDHGASAVAETGSRASTEPQDVSALTGFDPARDGYADAFYEIAGMLGFNASPEGPAHVWEHRMRPRLQAIMEAVEALEEAGWHIKLMAGDIKNPLQKRMADRWVAEARTAAAKARGEA